MAEDRLHDRQAPTLELRAAQDGSATLAISGAWRLEQRLPRVAAAVALLDAQPNVRRLGFDTTQLTDWDSGLVAFIAEIQTLCGERGIDCDISALPEGLQALLEMARGVPPERSDVTHTPEPAASFLTRFGDDFKDLVHEVKIGRAHV